MVKLGSGELNGIDEHETTSGWRKQALNLHDGACLVLCVVSHTIPASVSNNV
jgi:hypothetical protein